MHTVRHDPTRLQQGRRVRDRKNTTRLPTLNPEEQYYCPILPIRSTRLSVEIEEATLTQPFPAMGRIG